VNGLLKCARITDDGVTDVAQFGFSAEVVPKVQASGQCEGRYPTRHDKSQKYPEWLSEQAVA